MLASTKPKLLRRISWESRARPTMTPFRASSLLIRKAAAVGATDARFNATVALKDVAKTANYTRSYAESNGLLTLLTDGERLTGAYALGPEAGEWLQQATVVIRARVPLAVFRDTIQPFPTFSEIFVQALHDLHVASRKPAAVGHGAARAAV
jgi:dihydrolipoamide dehydrogenase